MKEDQRLHYLQAMEIDSWLLREDLKLAGAKAREQKKQPPAITPQALSQSEANPDDAKPIAALTWNELEVRVAEHLGIDRASTQSVLGAGHPQADLFIIGMRTTVGAAQNGKSKSCNKLFSALLQALCLSEQEYYISNLLHSDLEQRLNHPQEETIASTSLLFLWQQLNLVKPKLILVLGSFTAQQMLNCTAKLDELREREFNYGENNTPCRVTYHPEDLLAQPKEKAQAWQDLQVLIQRLRALRNA